MFEDGGVTRKQFLSTLALSAASMAIPIGQAQSQTQPPQEGADITLEDLKSAEKLFGISFTDEERKAILNDVRDARRGFESVRKIPITYQIDPPLAFAPLAPPSKGGGIGLHISSTNNVRKPASNVDLAYMSVRELAHLVKTKQISPVELTRLYLDRLQRYGEELLCVVTLTPELAMTQAKRAEAEIMAGKYRSPLHGIPYGIKDLFSAKGIPTSWGADPYKDQVFGYDAAVVERLEQAGAILVAKLSMGSLAMGDMWFKGRTKNPWNLEQGSSGSSAGSASATAAGLVPFAIGTETLGSICSPSHQCRVTGLRPTYGRVSRYGAMGLSWTMDKVGPICRYVEDCAIVFAAIAGEDPRDISTVDRPFRWDPKVDLKKLRIGYLIGPQDDPKDTSRLQNDEALKILAARGAKLDPIKFEPHANGLLVILEVESAAAFDEFTRGEKIHQLKNSSWPQTFRSNRYVPAVEYLQAQKARALLMRSFAERMAGFDLFVAPNTGGYTLAQTNLTGHPQVLVPRAPTERNTSQSVSFIGQPYEEAKLLAVAKIVQDGIGVAGKRPTKFS
jgi:Asp-tRNA(Asn)/Glu-tRNA(Gln) amidotransferase A subunit family amidase